MKTINIILGAALWSATAWRTPAAWRNPAKRPLWAAFFVLAAEALIAPATPGYLIDHYSGVHNLVSLLRNLAAVAAAACVVALLHDVAGSEVARLARLRPRKTIPAATMLAMTALFFVAPRPNEVYDPFVSYARDPWIIAYGTVWLAYFMGALVVATRLAGSWARNVDEKAMRIGLRLIQAGTSCGLVYAVHRLGMLFAHGVGWSPIPVAPDTELSELLVAAAVLLIVVGSSLPAYAKVRRAQRDRAALIRLFPLWLDLTEAVPHVRLDAARGQRLDRLDPRNLHDRLYRRIIEIRDALLTLNEHASAPLRDEARQHVAAAGLIGARADIATEACWLRAARNARTRGEQPAGEYRPPASGGRDLAAEAAALFDLSDAYHSDLAHRFAELVETQQQRQHAQEPMSR